MSFSSTIAGVRQSMRSRRRKPRLNQERNRCSRSASMPRQSGCVLQAAQQLAAHRHERLGAARRHVQAPEQLLARRIDDVLQRDQIARRRVVAVGVGGLADRLGRGREFLRQRVEELARGRAHRAPARPRAHRAPARRPRPRRARRAAPRTAPPAAARARRRSRAGARAGGAGTKRRSCPQAAAAPSSTRSPGARLPRRRCARCRPGT